MKKRYLELFLILLLQGGCLPLAVASPPYSYQPTGNHNEVSIVNADGVIEATISLIDKPIDADDPLISNGETAVIGDKEIKVSAKGKQFLVTNVETKTVEAILHPVIDSEDSIDGDFFILRIFTVGSGTGTVTIPSSDECSEMSDESEMSSVIECPAVIYISEECSSLPCETEYFIDADNRSDEREDPAKKKYSVKDKDNVIVTATPEPKSTVIDLNCGSPQTDAETKEAVVTCIAKFKSEGVFGEVPISSSLLALEGDTTATFSGNLSITDSSGFEKIGNVIVLNPSAKVDINGTITVDLAHIEQVADILVLAGYAPLENENRTFFMRTGVIEVQPWNGNITSLSAFQTGVLLQREQPIEIYSGALLQGSWEIYFGYRLLNETIIFNGVPIKIQVKP